jgi:hypothetical protein
MNVFVLGVKLLQKRLEAAASVEAGIRNTMVSRIDFVPLALVVSVRWTTLTIAGVLEVIMVAVVAAVVVTDLRELWVIPLNVLLVVDSVCKMVVGDLK